MPKMWRRDRADEAAEEWLGGRRWTAIAAFAFLVLVGVSGIVVAATSGGDAGGPITPVASLPTGISTVPPAGSAPPTGTSPADDAWDGTRPPPGVSWSLYRGMAVPSSPTAGPARDDGVVVSGFAHNRVGALLAAVQEPVRYVGAPATEWRRSADVMLAPGPGRAAWLDLRGRLISQPDQPGTTYSVVVGFRFVASSPTDTVIEVVGRGPTGTLSASPMHVAWSGGDWKFDPGPDGLWTDHPIDSLAGYVAWSPR